MTVGGERARLGFGCVAEAGDLERRTILLIESIRTFAGPFKEAPIWVVKPRRGRGLSRKTLDAFNRLKVHFIDKDLNRAWPNYGLANKTYAAAHVEAFASSQVETLCFMDSDMVCVQPPMSFVCQEQCVVAVRPVDLRFVGLLADEPLDLFWKVVYETCGVDASKVWNVETRVYRQSIRAYFQTGLVALRPERGIFRQALDNLERMAIDDRRRAFSRQQNVFIEQALFTATILSKVSREEILMLGPDYSYPLDLHSQLGSERKFSRLNDLAVIHSGASFYDLRWLNTFTVDEPLKTWLLSRLPLPDHRWSLRVRNRLRRFIGVSV